jgi:hypothetical protein
MAFSVLDRRDRGSAAVLVLVASSTVAVCAGLALASLAGDAVEAARARTAADAAALGSTSAGPGVAADLAERHGATLVEWHREGDDVVVRVRVGDAMATARATDSP